MHGNKEDAGASTCRNNSENTTRTRAAGLLCISLFLCHSPRVFHHQVKIRHKNNGVQQLMELKLTNVFVRCDHEKKGGDIYFFLPLWVKAGVQSCPRDPSNMPLLTEPRCKSLRARGAKQLRGYSPRSCSETRPLSPSDYCATADSGSDPAK